MESVSKQEKGKVLKAIADLTQKSSFEKTVSTALAYGATDLDSLINLHSWLHEKVLQLEPVQLQFWPMIEVSERQVKKDADI